MVSRMDDPEAQAKAEASKLIADTAEAVHLGQRRAIVAHAEAMRGRARAWNAFGALVEGAALWVRMGAFIAAIWVLAVIVERLWK